MLEVSNELLEFLTSGNQSAKRLTTVIEIYHQDAEPTANGFDPSSDDCLLRLAKVEGVTFLGETYQRLVKSVGRGKRTIAKEISSRSFVLSNSSREMIDFEYETGFEGLICVFRIIDRSLTENLEDSIVRFTGRCDKPDSFDKSSETVSITVKQILGATEQNILRRKFTPNDDAGRVPSDVLFEGFRVTQRSGTVQYTEKVRGGKAGFLFGLVGWLFGKKKVTRTMQYSSHSDLDSEKWIPIALGRVQMQGQHLAYEDIGTQVNTSTAWVDMRIAGYRNIRVVSANFNIVQAFEALKYGKLGGTVEDATYQNNDDPSWVGANTYSRLAWSRHAFVGSEISVLDSAPDIVAVILGLIVPVPNISTGEWTETDWTDNPVALARWVINSDDVLKLSDNWLDDDDNTESAAYCDHILVDQSNSELVQLNENQNGIAGSLYRNYQSTGILQGVFWRRLNGELLSDPYAPWLVEPDYQFYTDTPINSDDLGGVISMPPTQYRRRYTANVLISEQQKALDFLYDILLPSFNGYLVQKANGKIAIKCAKPADFAFVHIASAEDATEICVKNVNPWKVKRGKIVVGANLPTSEVRTVLDYRYKTDISIAVTASGGISSSAGTLGGGSDTVAPFVTLTVSSASGTKTIVIDGYEIIYSPSGDSTSSCAAMISAQINSHEILNKYIKAIWNVGEATVKVESRIGYLELDSALENAHLAPLANPTTAPTLTETASGSLAAGDYQVAYSYLTAEGETLVSNVQNITLAANKKITVSAITPPSRAIAVRWYVSNEVNGVRRKLHKVNSGESFVIDSLPRLNEQLEPNLNTTGEEILRIAMAFTDRANPQTGLTNSNMLKGTFRFPLGNKQPSTNQVLIKFRDASQDFQLTELKINDKVHQAKIKKTNQKEINGAAIDSYHQARRIANQKMAEWRDGDLFHAFTSDNEALLLEEGDIIAVTDESGRFVNETIRVTELDDNDDGYPSIGIMGRKYRRYYYDDQVTEKIVPLPIVTLNDINREQGAPVLRQSGDATNTAVNLIIETFTPNVRFRKIEMSINDDLANNETTPNVVRVIDANERGGALGNSETFIKASEVAAVTRFIGVSHSSNNETYGAVSNILEVTFASSGGSGGSGGSGMPPTLDGYWSESLEEVFLSWVSSGGSGTYRLESSINGGAWTLISDAVPAIDTSYSEGQLQYYYDRTVSYRIKRNDVDGWSNIAYIFIPGNFGSEV